MATTTTAASFPRLIVHLPGTRRTKVPVPALLHRVIVVTPITHGSFGVRGRLCADRATRSDMSRTTTRSRPRKSREGSSGREVAGISVADQLTRRHAGRK